jgi:RNA polymerase sigma factor (sigma-70 family)
VADREPNLCPNGANPLLPLPALDEAAFLRKWDDDIKRAARAAAHGDGAFEDDLAQQVRLRLLTAYRARPNTSTPYVRAIIANTIRSALRRDGRSFTTRSRMAQELTEDIEAPTDEPEDGDQAVVTAWAMQLPARLRGVYHHLYAGDRSQRQVALLMRMSQPRVAQLHQQLLQRGREELAYLAA